MKRLLSSHRAKLAVSVVAIGVLSGCASVSLEQNVNRVNTETTGFTDGQLSLAQSNQEREQRAQLAAQLLAKPLGQKEAVQLALTNSHALQALLAQGWAESADAAQVGRIANPIFSFERMVVGDELELARSLSFGLLDLLTLPARTGIAERRIEQAQLRLSAEVVDRVTQVRQAWVRAVAAQQALSYARQVFESAEAGAELARRMQSVGNFNRISRAREQSFYADAATRLATAQHQATASREELIRLLGLDEAQGQQLQLPERLPDLPKAPLEPNTVGALATNGRLDIRLAQSALAGAGKAQGLNIITSFRFKAPVFLSNLPPRIKKGSDLLLSEVGKRGGTEQRRTLWGARAQAGPGLGLLVIAGTRKGALAQAAQGAEASCVGVSVACPDIDHGGDP